MCHCIMKYKIYFNITFIYGADTKFDEHGNQKTKIFIKLTATEQFMSTKKMISF